MQTVIGIGYIQGVLIYATCRQNGEFGVYLYDTSGEPMFLSQKLGIVGVDVFLRVKVKLD